MTACPVFVQGPGGDGVRLPQWAKTVRPESERWDPPDAGKHQLHPHRHVSQRHLRPPDLFLLLGVRLPESWASADRSKERADLAVRQEPGILQNTIRRGILRRQGAMQKSYLTLRCHQPLYYNVCIIKRLSFNAKRAESTLLRLAGCRLDEVPKSCKQLNSLRKRIDSQDFRHPIPIAANIFQQ